MKALPTQRGFSLIEILVALSIFTVVVVAAVGVLLVMVDSNKKAQNIEAVMSNLSFALDSMTRDIRTGSHYFCQGNNTTANATAISSTLPTTGASTNNCDFGAASGRRSFAFREGGTSLTTACPTDPWIAFRHDPNAGTIERRVCDGDGSGGDNTASDWEQLTSSNVFIDLLEFTVTGAASSDDLPPRVTIYIEGEVLGTTKTQTDFAMQTTVSQLILDI